MSRCFLGLTLVLSLFEFAFAKENSNVSLILSPLQYSTRYIKQLDTQMTWQNNSSYAIGGRYQRHILFIDYGYSEDNSGNQALAFKKKHSEWLLSYRYLVYSLAAHLDLGLGFGLGMYEDEIKSRLGSQEISEFTGGQALSIGLVSLSGNWNYLFYSAELQILTGKDFDPQPTLGGLLRLGIQFVIF